MGASPVGFLTRRRNLSVSISRQATCASFLTLKMGFHMKIMYDNAYWNCAKNNRLRIGASYSSNKGFEFLRVSEQLILLRFQMLIYISITESRISSAVFQMSSVLNVYGDTQVLNRLKILKYFNLNYGRWLIKIMIVWFLAEGLVCVFPRSQFSRKSVSLSV